MWVLHQLVLLQNVAIWRVKFSACAGVHLPLPVNDCKSQVQISFLVT